MKKLGITNNAKGVITNNVKEAITMKLMMNRRTFVRLGATAVAVGAGALPIRAKAAFPDSPIDIIVPFSVGGGTDIWVRQLTIAMSKADSLGVPVNVVNIPGAKSLRGTGEAALAAPDGYKLIAFNPPSTPWAWYLSQPPFDIRKFTGLSVYVREPGIVVTSPVSEIDSFEGLQKAYASGGKKVIASLAKGTNWHIAALLLQRRVGIDWKNYVSYKGTADVIAAIMRREVEVGIVTASSALDGVRDGKLKPIAVIGATERLSAYPDVPTLKEIGFDPLEVCVLRRAVFAPAGIPEDRRMVLEKALIAAQDSPVLKKQYAALGLPPARGNGAEADKAIADSLVVAEEIDLKSIVKKK